MNNCTEDDVNIPFIAIENDILIETNQAFLNLSGFSLEELLYKPFQSVWFDFLRINTDPYSINANQETFLFTRSLEARNITIQKVQNHVRAIIYTFTEVPDSRIEDKVQFLNYLYHYSKIGVAVYSATDFIMLKANQTYLDFYRAPSNQASFSIGKTIYEIDKVFKDSFAERNWLKLLGGDHLFEVKEMPYHGFERGTTYWNITMVPIYVGGTIKYLAQMAEEVTEHVKQRQKIEEQAAIIKLQKEQLETIIENINAAVFVYDENKNYLYCNTLAKEYFPKASLNKFGDALDEYKYYDFDGNLIALDDMTISRVFRGEMVIGQKMTLKNSKTTKHISVNGKPVYDENGKLKFAVICSHDISEIKQAEIELYDAIVLSENRTEQLNTIVNSIDQAIVATDAEGNVLIMNPAALKIYDVISMKEYKHFGDYTKIFEVYSLDGTLIPLEDWPLSRALRGETFNNLELWIHRKDSDRYWLGLYGGTPVYDKKGKLLMAVITIYDITDKHMQQEYLLKAEKERNEALETSIKLKDEFLHLTSHELRTPTAVISSALQAIELLYKGEVTSNIQKHLNTIKQNTNRQLRLVNNLLEITKISSGIIKIYRSVVDIVYLTKAIVDSVQIYGMQKGIEITFRSSVESKNMYLDDEKIERIILNLLANAVKFTPKGKKIHVSVSSEKQSKEEMICISVKDEGIGIPKDKQQIIFERFGQVDSSLSRHAEGTGLGLTLVKMLVEAMDGEIILESEEGSGSTFTVILPVVIPVTCDEIAAADEVNNKLICNDNRIIQSASIEFSDIYFD